MPDAVLLLIVIPAEWERDEGHFLYRYARDGEFAGDTWHQSLEEAKGQANWEYGLQLQWVEVSVPDSEAEAFVDRVLGDG